MKAVVTGGAGFVGSHLCDSLLGRGDEVICVDNLATGSMANLVHMDGNSRFSFVEADVCEPLPSTGLFDVIFHLASLASPPAYLEKGIETLLVGAEGTRQMLDLAQRNGATFVLASTSEVYGDPLVHPQVESYWGNVNPVGPRSVYDESKRYAEALTTAYAKYRDVDVRIARIFNTYGPRMRPDDGRVITNFLGQACAGEPLTIYGDGSQTRSFCYVSDMIPGLLALQESEIPDPVNLGNPNEFTIRELADLVLDVTGSPSEIVYRPLPTDDPKLRRPDITVAANKLGWTPTVALEDGIREMWQVEASRYQPPAGPRTEAY